MINPGNVLKTREAGGNPNICFNEIEIFVPSGLFVSCSLLRGVDTWHPVNPGRKRRVAIKQQFLPHHWDWWPYILEVGNEQDKGDIMATFGLDSVAVSVFAVNLVEFDKYSIRRKVQVTTQTRSLVF